MRITYGITVELLWREGIEVVAPVYLVHPTHEVLVGEPVPDVEHYDHHEVEDKLVCELSS